MLTLAFDASAQKGSPSGLLGTGDAGALYHVSAEPPKDAHYVTKVFDAQFPARWGNLRLGRTRIAHARDALGQHLAPRQDLEPLVGAAEAGEGGRRRQRPHRLAAGALPADPRQLRRRRAPCCAT